MKFKVISTSLVALAVMACGTTNTAERVVNNSTEQNTPQPATVQNLEQANLPAKMADSNVVLIDVRTPGEVAEGYIAGTKQFIDINGADFASKIAALDKSKTYVVYCRSGARSARASQFMVDNGFTSVYNLLGGIMSYTGATAK